MRCTAPCTTPALEACLYDVTFVVVDVETTGGSPGDASLIEVGAAAFRGGEQLQSLEALVDPGGQVPPFVSELTGITDAMVRGAPPPSVVVPRLLSLIGPGVVVGHNVGFDLGFIDAALAALGQPPVANPAVDTLALARRLVRDQVPDCALGTLAAVLRLPHRPAHRALADALATADLLHRLIEVATGYGVLRLGDLLALPERLAPMAVAAAGSLVPA
jgi:DNA polymerase-3 subunit epsilon